MANRSSDSKKSIGKCPLCGADVVDSGKYFYHCVDIGSKTTDCSFRLWKDELARHRKGLITTNEARELLSGKEIDLDQLVNRAGRTFRCKGVLQKKSARKFGIKFLKIEFVVKGGKCHLQHR